MRFVTFSSILVAIVAAPAIHASVLRCGTNAPSNELKNIHATHAGLDEIERLAHPARAVALEATRFVIDTYVHIIYAEDSDPDNLPNETIYDQIHVLNNAYVQHGFRFVVQKIDRSRRPEWRQITFGSDAELDMKSTLRLGTYRDLNIYFTAIAPYQGQTLLGYATYPASASNRTFTLDGALMSPATVPGGSLPPYNLGITTVHEVGHWLGLLHTFQYDPEKYGPETTQGCSYGNGDQIYDTPAEKNASYGCQTSRDSCTGSSNSAQGRDPIHNYMDYSDDACMTEFTPGQARRMVSLYEELRINYNG